MIKEETVMDETIRLAIRQRAAKARSNDELVQAIFETFRTARIDLRKVPLEDMKTALVEATRASRLAPRDQLLA